MKSALVFVNYYCGHEIAARIHRLGAHDLEVVVVDNSGDYEGPGTIIRPGSNVGFGAACNRGIRSLDPSVRVVCLHNPDVVVTLDVITEICRRAGSDHTGIVAPALETPQGRVVDGYSYPRLAMEVLSGSKRLQEPRARATPNEPLSSVAQMSQRLKGAIRSAGRHRFGSGALLGVNVEAFNQVAGFDQRFVLYGEDLDLWHRMKIAGFEMHFSNDLMAFHERGGGSPASRETRELLRWAGIELFVQLHFGSKWRLYRTVHRNALRSDGSDNPIAEILRTQWNGAKTPVETSAAIREEFFAGVMEPKAEPELSPS